MSLQQQCLPLPRRRKRHSNQKSNKKDGNKQSNKSGDDKDSMEAEDEDMHIPMQISDLSEMDASTYLASVSAQASRLPFLFVADKSTATISTSKKGRKGNSSEETSHRQGEDIHDLYNNEATWQGSAMSLQYLYSNRLKIIPPPSLLHIPPVVRNGKVSMEEYTNSILHDFSELRLFLHNSLNSSKNEEENKGMTIENNMEDDDDDIGAIFSTFQKKKNSSKERKILIPPSKDCYNWHIFCLGKAEASGNVGGYYDISDDERDEEVMDKKNDKVGNSESCCQEINNEKKSTGKATFDVRDVPPNGYEPTTALLCQFDQIIIRRVITHHLHYISEGCSMTKQRGRWIYSLLARLEKPLHRDEASCLTSLLRELCRVRSELKDDELKDEDDVTCMNECGIQSGKGMNMNNISCLRNILAILNSLIVIIGIYFEQCNGLDIIMKVQE